MGPELPDRTRTARTPPWWIHPGRLTAYFVIPLYVFLVYVVPFRWPDVLVLKAPDYLHGGYASAGLLMLGSLSLAAFIGARVVIDHAPPAPRTIPPAALIGVGAVTIAAYAVWFFPVLLHGKLLLERDELSHTPGVTSFTQMGVPFVLCYLYCVRVSRQSFPWVVRAQFRLILVLTLFRVFVWKERLAAIEVFVPAAIVMLTHDPRPSTTRLRVAVRNAISRGGPFLAVPILLAAFTVTEYFRSWTTYSQTQSASLTEFMLARITSYYYTALNNGAGLLVTQKDQWPTYKLLYIAEWLYRLPGGLGDAIYDMVIGARTHPTDLFLNTFADVEFNNMSGLFPIVYDVGILGGALYFGAYGFGIGMLYRSMIRGGRFGCLLYPPFMVGVLEVMRVTYVNASRATLLFAGAFFLLSQMRRASDPWPVGATGPLRVGAPIP
jgi:hypothetical protein